MADSTGPDCWHCIVCVGVLVCWYAAVVVCACTSVCACACAPSPGHATGCRACLLCFPRLSSRTLGDRDGVDNCAYPWPTVEPLRSEFRKALVDYYMHMSGMGRAVVEAVLAALGVDVSNAAVTALFDPLPLPDGAWTQADIKLFRYDAADPADESARTGEIHVDIGLLTLIPAAAVSGLHAFDKQLNVWARLEDTRRAGDVVVFPSDVFRILTGGYLSGTLHRVIRSTVAPRYSIPFILRPTVDARIATLPRAGTVFESDSCVHPWDCSAYERYDPEFRVASFDHVLPVSRHFSYLPTSSFV